MSLHPSQRQHRYSVQESTPSYSSLAAALPPVGTFQTDAQGHYESVNPRWCEMTGLPPEAANGEGWLQAVYTGDRADIAHRWQQAWQHHIPFHAEYRLQQPSGEILWVLSQAAPLSQNDGQTADAIAGYVGTLIDITRYKQATQPATAESSTSAPKASLSNVQHQLNHASANRQQAEAILTEFRDFYLTLFESFPCPMWRTDPSGNCNYLNQAWLDLTGRLLHEELNKGWIDGIHPDDREHYCLAFVTAMNERCPFETEYRLLHRDGTYHWMYDYGRPFYDFDLCFAGYIGTCYDITERKQAETTLKQQAEQQRLIAETTQRIRQSLKLDAILTTTVAEVRQLLAVDRVLIYRLASNGSTQVITEAVVTDQTALLGRVFPSTLFTPDAWDRYHQGQVEVCADLESAAIAPPVVELLRPYSVRAKLIVPILQGAEQGANLWGLLVAHQCCQPRQWQTFEIELLQQLAGQVTIAIQQSELYEQVHRLNSDLEQQVQKRTAELQQAFEFEDSLKRITDKVRDSLDEQQILHTAVHELALALKVISCNASLYDLQTHSSTICYEYTALETLFLGRVVQMRNFSEGYDQLLRGQYFQFCSIVPNPVRGRVTMLACPIVEEQGVLGDLWLTKHHDVAFSEQDIRLVQQVANQCAIAIRQARLYQAVQLQVQELESLNNLKDDFLSTVSHELRTPMSNIKMAAQMLEVVLKQMGALDADNKAARYFEILHQECQREINLINDLLDLSRLNTSTPLLVTTIDTPDWLRKLVVPFQERAQSQQQQLQLDIPESLPNVATDAESLSRIVTELLNNACKYTPAHHVITVSGQVVQQHLRLSISNSGVEIPSHEISRIFNKFYRIPNNDPWKHGGTGLGLALVKKLVERLGAIIEVSSTNGHTQFSVDLPLTSEQ